MVVFLYVIIAAIVAVVAGILMAVCTKKAQDVVYTKLDKTGRITNIVLIPVYAAISLYCMALGFFCNPAYDGLLGILGWIVSVIIASAPLFCFVGLGLSAALRKKGKSKPSFAVQFVGFAGGALSIVLFLLFYGNLLKSLN